MIKKLKLRDRKLIPCQVSLSAIESAVTDKAEHRDNTGEDCIVRSSDSALECNVVVVEDSEEHFTSYTNHKDLEWIRISSILLKKSDKESIIDDKRLTDMHINAAQKTLSKQFLSFSGFDSTLKQWCIGKMCKQLHTNIFLSWLSLDYCKHSGM